jgi:hypothetical protein
MVEKVNQLYHLVKQAVEEEFQLQEPEVQGVVEEEMV